MIFMKLLYIVSMIFKEVIKMKQKKLSITYLGPIRSAAHKVGL